MKELTHEEWMENPTPRMMWVWDDEYDKVKRKVIYVAEQNMIYPVVTLTKNEALDSRYKHCAEIEEIKELKSRRMTNKELSRWLRENPTREFKSDTGIFVNYYYPYVEENADDEVADTTLIRENDGEWREPLVEEDL